MFEENWCLTRTHNSGFIRSLIARFCIKTSPHFVCSIFALPKSYRLIYGFRCLYFKVRNTFCDNISYDVSFHILNFYEILNK